MPTSYTSARSWGLILKLVQRVPIVLGISPDFRERVSFWMSSWADLKGGKKGPDAMPVKLKLIMFTDENGMRQRTSPTHPPENKFIPRTLPGKEF